MLYCDNKMAGLTQKRIFLWTVPRSLSTAFLRAMSTLENSKGMHEPYMMPFFKEIGAPFEIPKEFDRSFDDIKAMLKGNFAGYDIIFTKEMAAHLNGKLDDLTFIPRDFIHTFLIRNPIKTLKSYISAGRKALEALKEKRSEEEPDITGENDPLDISNLQTAQSFEYLYTIYEIVTTTYLQKSIIIDADDLQRNPEGTLRSYCREVGIEYQDSMVHWGPITPEQKRIWDEVTPDYDAALHFLGDAINGTEFKRTDPKTVSLDDIEERYREMIETNLTIYNRLYEKRTKPL